MNLKPKQSLLGSIFGFRCPKCRTGRTFKTSMYDLKHLDQMETNCEVCGHKFEIETGFFYGAMYVSYALTVAFCVALFVLSYLFSYFFWPSAPIGYYITVIIIGIVALVPVSFRLSRSIWIHMFTKYEPKK